MKIIKWGLIVLLSTLLIAAIGVYGYLRSTLPDYSGTKSVPQLGNRVEIIRDSFGMAHIFAQNDQDAYFAMGFSQAQDRLFQMDLARRAGHGRLSEILGKSLIKVDKVFRILNSSLPAEEWYDLMTPESREALLSFAKGVNYFLETSDSALPIEFALLGYKPEPWTEFDSMAVMLYMGWAQNYAFKTELLHAAIIDRIGEEMAKELFIDYPSGFPAIIPEGENPVAGLGIDYLKTLDIAGVMIGFNGGGASNGWVVSGKKSTSGKPLYSNDPHLGLSVPSVWYEAHMSTPSMNVSGSMIAGVPFIIAGANDHVAWGVTNSHHDDADFYLEKLHPENPDLYSFNEKWEPMKIRREVIKVKGAESIELKVKITRHGPVIDDLNDYKKPKGFALSMRWTQADFPKIFKGFRLVNRAKSIEDIEEAAGYAKSGQNWIYADDSGNIGFYFLGGIPKRDGFTGELPVPGWDGKHEWKGYVPNREQPHLRNPKQNYIVNANNKVEPEGYPYIITKYYATPDRFVRIKELLEEKEKYGPKDFEKMLGDVNMVMARDWMPNILASLKKTDLTETETEALKILKNWNFEARHQQVAPSIFNVFMSSFAENTFKKRLGPDLYKFYLTGDKNIPFNVLREFVQNGKTVWFDDPDTAKVEGMDEVLIKSYKDSIAYLEKELGNDVNDWQWGKLHTLTIYHPFGKKSSLMGLFFNIGTYPVDGSIFTVNPTYFKVTESFKAKGGGASIRHIIDFDNMKNSKRILPGGISGNFMSPHYDDQFDLWLSGKYRPFVLNKEEIEKDAKYRLNLLPGT